MRILPIVSLRISVAASATILVGCSLLAATSVEAKKKTYNTCTVKQIGSESGASCLDKNYTPGALAVKVVYGLYCGGNGTMLCCKQDSVSGKIITCSSVLTATPVSDRPKTSGGVLDPGPKQRPRRDAISTGGGILEPGLGGGFDPRGPASTGAPLSTGRGSAPPPGKIN
jgi:hypothetical protein